MNLDFTSAKIILELYSKEGTFIGVQRQIEQLDQTKDEYYKLPTSRTTITKFLKEDLLDTTKWSGEKLLKLIDEAPVKDEEFADRLIKYINGEIGKFTTSEKRILLQSIPDAQKSDTAKIAETILQGDELIDETNPLQNTAAGKQEHIQRIHQAGDDMFSEGDIKLNEEPRTPIDYDKNFDSDYNVYREVRLDPDEIEVDPKTFQFKTEEVDPETGVSPKLKGITEWDQDAANVVMVFEYADGRKVIADGHQRLALAKRIKSANLRLHILDGTKYVSCRMYRDFQQVIDGFGKNLFAAFSYNIPVFTWAHRTSIELFTECFIEYFQHKRTFTRT